MNIEDCIERINKWLSIAGTTLLVIIKGCLTILAILLANGALASQNSDCLVLDNFDWQDIDTRHHSIMEVDALSVIDACKLRVDNSNKAEDYTRLALANYVAIRQDIDSKQRVDKNSPLGKALNVSLKWAIALGDAKAYRFVHYLRESDIRLIDIKCLYPRITHRDCLNMAEKLEAGNTLTEAKDAVQKDYDNDPARGKEKRLAREQAEQREAWNIATGKVKEYVGAIHWTFEHSCNSGSREPILVRFFEASNGKLTGEMWPDKKDKEDVYIIPAGSRRDVSLSCAPTTQVCYGAGFSESAPRNWGLGLNAQNGCTSCCYVCGKQPNVALTCAN